MDGELPASQMAIMDELPCMGTDIFTILPLTVKLFVNELSRKKESIYSIPRTTHTYGSHPRQKLDFYAAPISTSKSPILIFLYGGGMNRGDKIIGPPLIKEPLVWHNIGSFFAQRGYTTIIPDYRRVNPEEKAAFPSGAEDLAAVLAWLEKYLEAEGGGQRDVFLMGNSAGGVHTATYLLHSRWKEERLRYVAGDGLLRLGGAVLASIPAHFDQAQDSRLEVLTGYYGSVEGFKNLCARGLLLSALGGKEGPKELGIPDVLVISAELDPVDEIIKPNEEFVELWKKSWDGLEYQTVAKHNHISLPHSLGTGEEEAEKWGVDVVRWLDGKRNVIM